jgi:hypothetical protein
MRGAGSPDVPVRRQGPHLVQRMSGAVPLLRADILQDVPTTLQMRWVEQNLIR